MGHTKNSGATIKWAVLALILLLLIVILGRFGQFFYQLSQPFNLSQSYKRQYDLDLNTTTNIVLASFKDSENPLLYLISYNPKEQTITALNISPQIYTSLPKDLGQWRLGSVYQLGQESNPPNGINLLKLSISQLVGLPVDGIMIKDDLGTEKMDDLILGL